MEDARRREEDRLKAQQALFDDLDRRPQKQPAPQAEPAPGATAASSGPAAEAMSARPPAVAPPAQPAAPRQQPQQPPPQQRQGAAAGAPAGVYVPPSWNTRPPALEPRLEGEEASAPLCGCGPGGGGPGQQLFAMVGLAAPSEESFTEWFQDWFAQEYFPGMSKKLQAELVQRARSRSFLSGISSQVKKWAMANTDARLQADVWFTYFQNYAPPRYHTVGCVKTASMNLGSQAVPLWLTFWGVPDAGDPSGAHWVLPPWSSFDVDIGALVDELDGRAAPLGWLPRARTPLGRSAQPADPAAMAAELEDLEASASAASAARSWSRSWSAGIAALAAAALLVGATALARRRGALEAHGFGSDADLVSFSLAKVKNDTAKAPPSEHDLDLDSVVAAATLRVEALSHDRALAEGMEQMAAAVSADDKVQIVKALRTLRVAVNGLIGEVKSLETGLHMCGRIVCTGRDFLCCFGMCCAADSVCCPGVGAANGSGICCAAGAVCCPDSGLCGAPGSQCKSGIILAGPANHTR